MFLNSRPPMPPSGQEGRGSYVWVPYHGQVQGGDDVVLEEQQVAVDFVDDITDEDNDGSAHTQEEHEDIYIPEDVDVEQFDESGIADDEEEGEEEGTGQIA